MTTSEKAGGTSQSGHGILERIKHEKQITLPMCPALPECPRETSCGGKAVRSNKKKDTWSELVLPGTPSLPLSPNLTLNHRR
jgi:hypothetical protein